MKWIGSALLFTLALTGPILSERVPSPIVDSIAIRGHRQLIHVYGARGTGAPVLMSSGDGGWMHLAPQVAERLASRGFFVVGFDAKSYLESFTSGTSILRPQDVPGDYRLLAAYAAKGFTEKPILIGVSEGAGLSDLAATDTQTQQVIAGIIELGLSDLNELGVVGSFEIRSSVRQFLKNVGTGSEFAAVR